MFSCHRDRHVDTWIEVRPLVMQNTRTGELAVFQEDERGEVRYAAIGNLPSIIWVKLPWYGGPFVKWGLLGFSLLTSLFTVIAAIVTPFIPRRKREADGHSPWPGRLARWTALLLSVLAIVLIAFIIMVLMKVAWTTPAPPSR